MAQKTEKEETEFKVPETITLCINNCGVTGNPATNNMCQKCFNASSISSSNQSNNPLLSSSASATVTVSPRSSVSRLIIRDPEPGTSKKEDITSDSGDKDGKRLVNRCSGCKRKVGLTGFRCRCGELFCWEHRYSDRHDCSYDYKTAGRDAIARENPVVKAAKIVRV